MMAAGRWGAALLVCLLVAGCGARRRTTPPPAAPALATPALAVPADLDIAMRLDLGRMRAELGEHARRALGARQQGGSDSGQTRLTNEALLRANTVWLGFRPGLPADLTDNVLVLRGDFEGFDPEGFEADPPWGMPRDLGGGWRRYERPPAATRAAAVRVYQQHDDLLVLVSTAEVDAVERALERGQTDGGVQVPNAGTIALAARGPALAGYFVKQLPSVARLLRATPHVAARLDLPVGRVHGEIELELVDEASATTMAHAFEELIELGRQHRDLQPMAAGASVEAVGRDVVVRLDMGGEALAYVAALLAGDT